VLQPSNPVKRILIVRTDRVGDVVLTLPMLPVLRSCYPKAHIAMLLRKYTGEIIVGNPYVNDLLWYDNEDGLVPFGTMAKRIRKQEFDVSIVVYPTLRLAWLSGVKFADSLLGWAVGDSGIIFVTTNGGGNWNRQNSGTARNLYGTDFSGGPVGWAVGSSGLIIHTSNGGGVVAVDEQYATEASGFQLLQNSPNPFNRSTIIEFSLTSKERIKLVVYDMLGREVLLVVDGYQHAGSHRVLLDASRLATGLYFYRLETEGGSKVKKMLLLK